MKKILKVFSRNLLNSAKDLAPIVLVIGFFQLVVLQQNIPNLFDIALGTGLVTVCLKPASLKIPTYCFGRNILSD
jgi:hypothetical protein